MKNSPLYQLLGKEATGEIITSTESRVYIQVEFEEQTNGEKPHTLIIVCPHERVTS